MLRHFDVSNIIIKQRNDNPAKNEYNFFGICGVDHKNSANYQTRLAGEGWVLGRFMIPQNQFTRKHFHVLLFPINSIHIILPNQQISVQIPWIQVKLEFLAELVPRTFWLYLFSVENRSSIRGTSISFT